MNSASQLPQRQALTPVRRLGFGEVRMHLMHSLYSGTAQGAAVVQLRGRLDPDALRRAVLRIQCEHEILNMNVRRIDDDLWFCRRELPTVAQLTEIRRQGREHWVTLLERENSKALNYDAGLWHLFLLRAPECEPQEHELILLTHHGIIDGLATAAIFEYLLRETTEPSAQPPALLPRPVAPSAEEFSPFPMSWREYEERQASLASKRVPFDPLPYLGSATVPERRTLTIPLALSLDACRRIRADARSAAVSVNSYLSAVFLLAIKAMLPARGTTFLHTAMSLRQLSAGKIVDADLGCYLSVISTAHDMTRPALSTEALAREHQTALLGAAIASSRNPNEVDLDKFAALLEPLAHAQHFLLDFGMTFIELPLRLHYADLDVVAFYGAANRAIGSAAAVLQGIQLGEALFLTLSYTTPLQTTQWAEALARALLAQLEAPVPSEGSS